MINIVYALSSADAHARKTEGIVTTVETENKLSFTYSPTEECSDPTPSRSLSRCKE